MNINKNFTHIPNHIGIIPDGNRRWANINDLPKQDGYAHGISPGMKLYELCLEYQIKELTFYGFTVDNTKRPSIQTQAFRQACVDAVNTLSNRDANLLVVGNTNSPMFPQELIPYTKERVCFGIGLININFLVNYGWNWDLKNAIIKDNAKISGLYNTIESRKISRIDLIIRWGGRRRLSGFLPIQSVYSDFYIIDDYWPDFTEQHFYNALEWYQEQDVTLGG